MSSRWVATTRSGGATGRPRRKGGYRGISPSSKDARSGPAVGVASVGIDLIQSRSLTPAMLGVWDDGQVAGKLPDDDSFRCRGPPMPLIDWIATCLPERFHDPPLPPSPAPVARRLRLRPFAASRADTTSCAGAASCSGKGCGQQGRCCLAAFHHRACHSTRRSDLRLHRLDPAVQADGSTGCEAQSQGDRHGHLTSVIDRLTPTQFISRRP